MIKFVVTLGVFATYADAIGRTLADCQTVAAMFDNTCGSTSTALTSITSHAGAEMACTGTMRCPGGTTSATFAVGSECKWTRKLCVTCSTTAAGVVQIRTQTNGLPNHCFQGGVSNAAAKNTDWTVNFNPDVTGMIQYAATAIDSSTKVTELLCDIQRTASANMIAMNGYTANTATRRLLQTMDSIGTSGGIGLSGAYITNALQADGKDAVENEKISLDTCLSHPTPFG